MSILRLYEICFIFYLFYLFITPRPNSVFYVYFFLEFILMIVLKKIIIKFFFYNELNYRFSPLD